MSVYTQPPGSTRESANDYRGEVYRYGAWRVAECRDRLQWLLQRQRPGKAGVGGAWDSISFCTTRAALVRLWRKETGEDGAALLALLPERIGKGA